MLFFSANAIFWAFFHENTQFRFILFWAIYYFRYGHIAVHSETGSVTLVFTERRQAPTGYVTCLRSPASKWQGQGWNQAHLIPRSAFSNAPAPQCACSACCHQLDYGPLEGTASMSLSLQFLAPCWHVIKVNKYLFCKHLLNVTFFVLCLPSLLRHSHFS